MSELVEGGSPRTSRLGRYELITQIGQGGMAEVLLALQRGPAGFEKLVVVKLVHQNLASQKSFVDMLLDEARLAALVKHPNVVDIYDLGHADGRYFIAMEYLEGEPLLALLRAGREGKRLDPLSTGRLIADTAEGLDAAHELRTMAGEPIELVHHDIALGNIDLADARTCDTAIGYCVPLTCPAACDSCNLETQSCAIACGNGPDACNAVTCPAGFDCTVTCTGTNACGTITCGDARSCTVACSGGNQNSNACGDVQCGAGACAVTCADNACGTVACNDSCGCDVACASGSACEALMGCAARCVDGGTSCSAALPGCSTCP